MLIRGTDAQIEFLKGSSEDEQKKTAESEEGHDDNNIKGVNWHNLTRDRCCDTGQLGLSVFACGSCYSG
jgi:hypothetical protein